MIATVTRQHKETQPPAHRECRKITVFRLTLQGACMLVFLPLSPASLSLVDAL